MKPISTLPDSTQVICLNAARSKYMAGRCQHKNLTVDEDLNDVLCDDCGAKLNPVAVLMRFANEESRWKREGEKLRELHKALDARVRCKCQHCGQMTRIRV